VKTKNILKNKIEKKIKEIENYIFILYNEFKKKIKGD
jgi:hypothetical protein